MGLASWDILKLDPKDDRDPAERAAARVAPLAFLRGDPDDTRRAALELANRYRVWSERPLAVLPPEFTELFILIPMLVIGMLMTGVPLTAFLTSVVPRRDFLTATLSMTGGLIFTALALALLARRERFFRPLRRFRRCHCPDCGYDLAGTPPAPAPFDVVTLGAVLGPEHCPECAAHWPLVPPAPYSR